MTPEQIAARATLDQAEAALAEAVEIERRVCEKLQECTATIAQGTQYLRLLTSHERAMVTALAALEAHKGQCPLLDEAAEHLRATLLGGKEATV